MVSLDNSKDETTDQQDTSLNTTIQQQPTKPINPNPLLQPIDEEEENMRATIESYMNQVNKSQISNENV